MSGTTTNWTFPYPTGTDSPPNVASDMQSLATANDTALFAVGNARGLNSIAGTGTTTSAAYANIPAPSSVSFTKRLTVTRLRIDLMFDSFSTAVPTRVWVGVRINGVDTDVSSHSYGAANQYESTTGVTFVSGLAAGVYTVQCRWLRSSGAGTVSVDGGGYISFAVQEVSA